MIFARILNHKQGRKDILQKDEVLWLYVCYMDVSGQKL